MDRFFDHPKHGPCYNTGDRVKVYQPDSNIDEMVLIYIGRSDTQVKIDGQRIDLNDVTQGMKSDLNDVTQA